MTDGRDHAPGYVSFRATFPWMQIFRCFQVALDPRKLLVAAAGILVMSIGWYILSAIFYYKAPERNADAYSNSTMQKEMGDKVTLLSEPQAEAVLGTKLSANADERAQQVREATYRAEGNRRFATDFAQWQVLSDLAGPYGQQVPVVPGAAEARPAPPGRFRTMPWDEYRGPNPFLFVTSVLSGTATERHNALTGFLSGSVPVLIEPLVKLLVPVAKLISPGVSPLTRFYLFLILIWNIAVWAFFGGIITRLAAVQLANKGPLTLRQATRFVANRYVNYLLSPMVPLAIIAAVVLGLIVLGVIALIPFIGDLLVIGLGLPLIILGGAVMAVFLVGLVGYPLMYPTLSVEGDSSDTFDALSRSINYVYQAPWHYIWYWLVAIVYGAAVTFFVLFFTTLMVYMGKWAVGIPASAVWSDRKPEFLFVYAPESFGWRELLLADSPYAVHHETVFSTTGRPVDVYRPVDPVHYEQHRKEYYFYNTWGAGLVGFWLALLFLMMLGFSYSFFWTAATVIYFLLRKRVDEAEPDEVFLEEEEPEAPLAPPKIADGTAPAPASPSTSLPVITGPTAPVPPSPPVVPPTPPPTVPFTGLAAPEPGPSTTPPADGPKLDGEKPV
jgi:hypothetical protein